jgi:malonate-semialdehyde dehydrogenase (acetylating) / methylmalonate-semialdehyde dehydrogenase
MTKQLSNLINGEDYQGVSQRHGPIYNPSDGSISGYAPFATGADVDQAVQSAANAFPSWAATPPPARAKILFKFRQLLEDHKDEIADLISREHGKSLTESLGSLSRGLDVVEFACGIPHHLKGDFTENVGRGVDCYSVRQPLGVCAGITPFNFPAMIPLWTAPVAIACGNTFVLKPSERNPSTALRLVELALEAGLPKGVWNVVHGDKEAVDALLTHPLVQAISFVGQTSTAQYVQQTAINHGKRVQAFGGAKNHMLIMPDAEFDQTVDALVGSAYGSAGERCMAISVALVVGDEFADKLVKALAQKVQALKIGSYKDSSCEMGPLITPEHKQRVLSYIDSGVKEGATLVVDGRAHIISNSPGFYVGGCLFDHVQPQMKIYQEEIFGPVLCVVRIPSYEAGIKLINDHPYGNGVSIFTRDGDCARDFCTRIQIGMVGVNIPIPVPVGFHSFGGWKKSAFTDMGMHGMEGVRFYTKLKTITSRWPSGIRSGVNFSLPTSAD